MQVMADVRTIRYVVRIQARSNVPSSSSHLPTTCGLDLILATIRPSTANFQPVPELPLREAGVPSPENHKRQRPGTPSLRRRE